MIPKLHYLSQGNTPQEHLANIQKALYLWIRISGVTTSTIKS